MNKAMLVAALLTFSTSAIADIVFDIEYMPASEYHATVGAGVYHFKPTGVSVYGNIHASYESPDAADYDGYLPIGAFGDEVTNHYTDLTIWNIGITTKVSDNLGLYAGAGMGMVTGMTEMYDPYHILSDNGYYVVGDSSLDESGVNFNAGAIYTYERLALNVGFQSFTSTVTFGVGYKF